MDGLEKIEDAIAALDREVADAEGGGSFRDQLIVDKGEDVGQLGSFVNTRYDISWGGKKI